MWYTITEIIVYLVIAAMLGFGLGYLFNGRRNEAERAAVRRASREREEELLGAWKRKLAACEERCLELERKAAPSGGERGARPPARDGKESGRRGKEGRAVEEPGAEKAAGENRPAGKEAESGRPAAAAKQPPVAQKVVAAGAGQDSPARGRAVKRAGKPGRGGTRAPVADSATAESADESARQRVKNLVARASGNLAEVAADDRKAARERVKEMVKRLNGGRKPPHDNLKKIYGIGPKFEKMLNGLGITSYRQLACMSRDEIRTLAAAIDAFPERVERDNWVEGARQAHVKKYGRPPE